MEEINKRKEAIDLWLKGKNINEIGLKLSRSRQWVHKWINRYNADRDNEWFKSFSRAPKTVHPMITRELEEQIINFRQMLCGQKYSQTGATSIQYEFYKAGMDPPPVWTINRILRRNNLIFKSLEKTKKGTAYPNIYFSCHQMDLIGPRYLKGGFRYYLFNIIDIETHYVLVWPVVGKSTDHLIHGIIAFWQDFGFPDCLQMDNEMAFRGSNRHPRSLGLILRFILSQGVVPLFIPPAEPWRNGLIEKFNDTCKSKFIASQLFNDFCQLKDEAVSFSSFHNQNHRYSTQGNRTPNEMIRHIMPPIKLPEDFVLPDTIPLEEGTIIFIRFVRSNLAIIILGTAFQVKKELMYSYVVAELIIHNHTLLIKQDNLVHHKFYFEMPVDW
jgi:putative transposase